MARAKTTTKKTTAKRATTTTAKKATTTKKTPVKTNSIKEEKAMSKTNDFSYEVKNTIGKLGDNSKREVRVVSWNKKEPKIDIREWYEMNGEERAGKGISLTNEEARTLIDLLTEYLNDDDDDF